MSKICDREIHVILCGSLPRRWCANEAEYGTHNLLCRAEISLGCRFALVHAAHLLAVSVCWLNLRFHGHIRRNKVRRFAVPRVCVFTTISSLPIHPYLTYCSPRMRCVHCRGRHVFVAIIASTVAGSLWRLRACPTESSPFIHIRLFQSGPAQSNIELLFEYAPYPRNVL